MAAIDVQYYYHFPHIQAFNRKKPPIAKRLGQEKGRSGGERGDSGREKERIIETLIWFGQGFALFFLFLALSLSLDLSLSPSLISAFFFLRLGRKMMKNQQNGEFKEDSIAVAIDKDKGSQFALKWAVDNILSRGQTITLLHVKQRQPSIPTPGSKMICILFIFLSFFVCFMCDHVLHTKCLMNCLHEISDDNWVYACIDLLCFFFLFSLCFYVSISMPLLSFLLQVVFFVLSAYGEDSCQNQWRDYVRCKQSYQLWLMASNINYGCVAYVVD